MLIALAAGWPFVLFCRLLDRVGKGVRTSPRDALIASDTPPEMRGRAFGFHRAIDTAGAVVGPLIGLGLYELLNHQLRPLFLISLIPALVSIALIFLVREGPLPVRVAPPTSEKGGSSSPVLACHRHHNGFRAGQLFRRADYSAHEATRTELRRGDARLCDLQRQLSPTELSGWEACG